MIGCDRDELIIKFPLNQDIRLHPTRLASRLRPPIVTVFLLSLVIAFRGGFSTVPAAGAQIPVSEFAELVQITQSGFGAYESSLTTVADGFAAAWYDTRDGQAEIYLRFLNPDGTPRGPEQRLTHSVESSYEADIVAVGDAVAVVWYDQTDLATYEAKLGLWDRDGSQRWVRTLSAPGRNGRIPVIVARGREIFCAWLEDDRGENLEVWADWYDMDGDRVSEPWHLGTASSRTWNLNATLGPDQEPWLVFDAQVETGADEIFLVEAGVPGSEPVGLTLDDGFDSKYPDLAFGAETVALTWWDRKDGNEEIYISISSFDSLKESLASNSMRITTTPGESIGAFVTWNAPRFGLAWNDDTVGQHEIYFQSLDSQGQRLGPARRLTDSEPSSLIPAIRRSGDGFALVWNEVQPREDDVLHDEAGGRSEVMFGLVP
jgi:hypothetical protein